MSLTIYQNDPNFLLNAFFSGQIMVATDLLYPSASVETVNFATGYGTQFSFAYQTDAIALEAYFAGGPPPLDYRPIQSISFYNPSNTLIAVFDLTYANLMTDEFAAALESYEATGNTANLYSAFRAANATEDFHAGNLPQAGTYTFDSSLWDAALLDTFGDIYGSAYADNIIASTTVSQTIHAGGGNDVMHGRNQFTFYYGEAGDDVLNAGSAGQHFFDGGTGFDRLQFDALDDAFTVTPTGTGSATVTGPQGTYQLTNTEIVQFHLAVPTGTVTSQYDIGGLQNWTQVTRTLDSGGNVTESAFILDNGRSVTYTFSGGLPQSRVITDLNDDFTWTSRTYTWAPGTSALTDTVVMDDGREIVTVRDLDTLTTTRTNTDTADAFIWSHIVAHIDDTGAMLDETLTYDDGRVRVSTYDAGVLTTRTTTDHDDMFGWTSVTDSFDATGARTARDITYDDGGMAHFDYAPV